MFPLCINHLERIFNKLDKNSDGRVSIDELMWLLERMDINTCRADELELLAGKTSLDFIEFLFFYDSIFNMDKRKDDLIENDLRKAFEFFDSNGDGFISSEELRNALCRLGLWDDQHLKGLDSKSIVDLYDRNSDGFLDFEEFKTMMLDEES